MSDKPTLPAMAGAIVLARASLDPKALRQAQAALRGVPAILDDIIALKAGIAALDRGDDLPAAMRAASLPAEAVSRALECVWYAPPTPALVDALGGYLDATAHRRVVWALEGATCDPVEAPVAPGVPAW